METHWPLEKILENTRVEKQCLANIILEKAIVEKLQPLLIYSKFVRKLKIDNQMKKRGIESYGQVQGENTVTSSET